MLASCEVHSPNEIENPFYVIDAEGKKRLTDFPSNWLDFQRDVNNDIAATKRGQAIADYGGPGSRRNYKEFWRRQIAAKRANRENPEKYVGYIQQRLREEGLQRYLP
jgi:hypothetical protein